MPKKTEGQLHNSEDAIRYALQGSSQSIIVAHIDCELRYTFIYNPASDSPQQDLLGKRDDEIETSEGAIQLCELKRNVIETGLANYANISFPHKSGSRICRISVAPVFNDSGQLIGATSVSIDITNLEHEMAKVKKLSNILPLCSYCKSIRDDNGEWQRIDIYLTHLFEAKVSHGICPGCMQEHFPQYWQKHI